MNHFNDEEVKCLCNFCLAFNICYWMNMHSCYFCRGEGYVFYGLLFNQYSETCLNLLGTNFLCSELTGIRFIQVKLTFKSNFLHWNCI